MIGLCCCKTYKGHRECSEGVIDRNLYIIERPPVTHLKLPLGSNRDTKSLLLILESPGSPIDHLSHIGDIGVAGR